MAAISSPIWDRTLDVGCSRFSNRQGPRWHQQVSCSTSNRTSCKFQSGLSFVESFNNGSHHSVTGGLNHRLHHGYRVGQTSWTGGLSRRTAGRLQVCYSIVTEKIVGGSQFGASADQSVRRLILLRHAKSSWTDRSIKVIRDIISAAPAPTSRSRISRIWSTMEKSWFSDHERPLSKRGRQAAANIAIKLHECSGWEPQLILCSDSTRTRETLNIMQEQLPEFFEGEVRYFSSFYSIAAMDGQTVQHLQEIICKYSKDDITTIMCMGHNRGWEEAASVLSGANVELKTANAALLQTRGNSWQEAFERAGSGGWKLVGIVRPDCIVEGAVQ